MITSLETISAAAEEKSLLQKQDKQPFMLKLLLWMLPAHTSVSIILRKLRLFDFNEMLEQPELQQRSFVLARHFGSKVFQAISILF